MLATLMPVSLIMRGCRQSVVTTADIKAASEIPILQIQVSGAILGLMLFTMRILTITVV